jgi:hypothetical protein
MDDVGMNFEQDQPKGVEASERAAKVLRPVVPSTESLAQRLSDAATIGATIDFRGVDSKQWALALDMLIQQSMLNEAALAAPRLALTFPHIGFFHTMVAILDSLPPQCADAGFASFQDDVTKEVQIIPCAGAQAVLLGFCGRAQKMGMPLNLIHRWFGTLRVHVIYLRDYQGFNYDRGIQALASDLPGTLQKLRSAIADLGSRRVVCYGNSLGGYGALRYGLELRSEAVLSFAGPTNLAPDFLDTRWRQQGHVSPGLNLRPLYEAANDPPRAHLVYAEHHASDRAQAGNFAGLPTVSVETVPDAADHDVFLHVLFEGRFESLIRWLVDPQRSPGLP